MHIMGASGQGKSKFLEHCIRQDIVAGHGVCLIDPEGDLYERIVEFCAYHQIDLGRKVHLFDPTETEWRFRFNPLHVHPGEKPLHRVGSVIEALAQVWGGEESRNTPAIRTTLRAIMYALLENGYTMAEAFYLTSTKDEYQLAKYLTRNLSSAIMQEIWSGYHAAADRDHMTEFSGARRRLSELLGDDEMREILATYDRPLDFRKCMDDGDIVLVNLSPEAMGDDAARAFGALLVREMFYCSSRRDPRTAKERPFFAYIDECADFLTNDISKILARSRKRGLHVVLAHQWLQQLRERGDDIYHGVMGIQNKVIFGGISDEDAVIMADQLFRSEYDLEVPISVLTKPGVARYERTWFNNWSRSRATTETEAESETHTETDTISDSSVESISLGGSASASQVYDADGFPTGTYTVTTGSTEVTVDAQGQAVGSGTSRSSSTSHARSETEGQSAGASEALVPILADFVGGVHSIENVRHMAISRLRTIPPRNAVVKGFNTPTFDISTFNVVDVPVHPDNIAAFKDRVLEASAYVLAQPEVRHIMLEKQRELYQVAGLPAEETAFAPHPAALAEDEEESGAY